MLGPNAPVAAGAGVPKNRSSGFWLKASANAA